MRHDHTDWLIHFVRDRNPQQDFGDSPEEIALRAGGELAPDAKAFEVLKTIVRLGGLTPGYSLRNGRTTIYGGDPVVCATEMPIYSLAVYARDRRGAGNVSAYGIGFLKSEFFDAGGRPVIYALSTGNPTYLTNSAWKRVFDDATLLRREQYRYVAYNPSKRQGPLIDWSHEREWRWNSVGKPCAELWMKDSEGLGATPALPLFKGRPFTRVCLIVWTRDEAAEMQQILTGFHQAGGNNYDTSFDKTLIERSHIIVLQDVVDAIENRREIEAQTIEGLAAAQLIEPIKVFKAPPNAASMVARAMTHAASAAAVAARAYAAPSGLSPLWGHARAITTAVTSPIVQFLLGAALASGPFDGDVWINVPGVSSLFPDLEEGKAVFTAVAAALSADLGVPVQMHAEPD